MMQLLDLFIFLADSVASPPTTFNGDDFASQDLKNLLILRNLTHSRKRWWANLRFFIPVVLGLLLHLDDFSEPACTKKSFLQRFILIEIHDWSRMQQGQAITSAVVGSKKQKKEKKGFPKDAVPARAQ
jgi:hypothetical protein